MECFRQLRDWREQLEQARAMLDLIKQREALKVREVENARDRYVNPRNDCSNLMLCVDLIFSFFRNNANSVAYWRSCVKKTLSFFSRILSTPSGPQGPNYFIFIIFHFNIFRYYQIVLRPMDYTKIERKIDEYEYIGSEPQFFVLSFEPSVFKLILWRRRTSARSSRTLFSTIFPVHTTLTRHSDCLIYLSLGSLRTNIVNDSDSNCCFREKEPLQLPLERMEEPIQPEEEELIQVAQSLLSSSAEATTGASISYV